MESQNPTTTGDAASPQNAVAEIASKWRRFGTLLADFVIHWLSCVVIAIVVALTLGEQAIEGDKVYFITLPAFFVYYVAFEGTIGRTPGKMIFGTRVVTNWGTAPSLKQAIGRTLSRFIPFEPLSVLFAEDGAAIGWHDSIARTKVIRVR